MFQYATIERNTRLLSKMKKNEQGQRQSAIASLVQLSGSAMDLQMWFFTVKLISAL